MPCPLTTPPFRWPRPCFCVRKSRRCSSASNPTDTCSPCRNSAGFPDIDDLAETIQSDAAISFRLLSFLNSAAFGLPRKIKSVQHAIRLLGWDRMKNWLRVVLLNDMSQAVETGDLLQLSAQRGKFLVLVARSHDYWGFDPESLHLLGLFSLMDTLLFAPMEEIVTFLPIEQPLKKALCGDAGNVVPAPDPTGPVCRGRPVGGCRYHRSTAQPAS